MGYLDNPIDYLMNKILSKLLESIGISLMAELSPSEDSYLNEFDSST